VPKLICFVDLSQCFDYHVRLLFVVQNIKGASENLEFAQVQGAGKISPRRIYRVCKQEIFLQRSSWDEIWIFRCARNELAGLPALQSSEPGQVRKEAATAINASAGGKARLLFQNGCARTL